MAGLNPDLRFQPWNWRLFGVGSRWILSTRHGGAKVVLSAGLDHKRHPCLLVRKSEQDGQLVPLTPDHPVAQVLELAPSMYEICLAVARLPIKDGEDLIVDAARVVARQTGVDLAGEEEEGAERDATLFRPPR
jgi:hypothetical protein